MTAPLLPEEAPKHLLGIGEVDDLLGGIALGLDVFDCAVPTRLARHGVALAPDPETRFRLDLRKGGWVGDRDPLVDGCPCPACQRPRPRLPQLPLPRRGADRGPAASSSTTSPTCSELAAHARDRDRAPAASTPTVSARPRRHPAPGTVDSSSRPCEGSVRALELPETLSPPSRLLRVLLDEVLRSTDLSSTVVLDRSCRPRCSGRPCR